MNKIHFSLITVVLVISSVFANDNIENSDPKVKAHEWIAKQKPLGFLENKGQMADENGRPINFVLFKAAAPNLNIWITTSGLTYQFFKIEEQKDEEVLSSDFNAMLKEGQELEVERKTGSWHRVDMVLKGSSIKKENVIAEEELTQGNVSYYLGHCPDGIFNVNTYAKITINEIYPGIDWILYTSPNGGIKHDFVVHPHSNPDQIKIAYEGSGKIKIMDNQIYFENELGKVREGELLCYQGDPSNLIASKYKVQAKEKKIRDGFCYEVGIETAKYNYRAPLIIDPQLVWATFFGGSGSNGVDGPMSIANDDMGNIFATGYSDSPNFPTINSGTYYQGVLNGGTFVDTFILKFNNSGILLWSTYYGGSLGDWGNSIATDLAGNVYITGRTASSNFPVTMGSFQIAYSPSTPAGGYDTFIIKFNNSGARLWATYYGGNGNDIGNSIATDAIGNVFVTGSTQQVTFGGNSFPVLNSGNYFQLPGFGTDIFILKFNSVGVRLWATVYGGSSTEEGYAIAIDNSNNIFITGRTQSANFPVCNTCPGYFDGVNNSDDIFILKFSNTGVRLWATFYGGTLTDIGKSIATDSNGNIFVTGWTNSANFPLQNAGTFFQGAISAGPINADAFILKFDNTGTRLWATYFGGSGNDYANVSSYDNIAIDACGTIYISFETHSNNLLTKPQCNVVTDYYDSSFNGSNSSADIFIAHFSNSGILIWATYWGGDGNEYRSPLTVDSSGNLFVSGEWMGSNTGSSLSYPLTNPGGGVYYQNTFGGGDDGFFAKFTPTISSFTQSQVNSTSCTPCNGSATISLTCSEPNYSFLWSNGNSTLNTSSPVNSISGLCPGTYTVTATSNCNQAQVKTFVITGTSCGGISASVNSATMCSASTPCPILAAKGAGGTAPYIYAWSPGTGLSSTTGNSVSACPIVSTNYTVTVTDNTGLTAISTAVVTVNPSVSVNVTPTNITCSGGTNGSATANPGSGTPGYIYNWSNGGSTSTISNLTSQIYTVTITDSKGCTSTSVAIIISPPVLIGQFAKGFANCLGCGCKEWIIINATGGTSPYAYTWPDGNVNRYKNQLCPGAYLVNVKDKNGCSVDVNVSAP